MVNSTIWASSLKLQQTLVQIGVTLALLFLTWPRYRTCFWSWITMGKLIPFCASRVGCGFPKVPLGEITSRFTPLEMDAVSRRGSSGKRHPFGPEKWDTVPAGHGIKPPQLVWLRRLYSLRCIVFGSLR